VTQQAISKRLKAYKTRASRNTSPRA